MGRCEPARWVVSCALALGVPGALVQGCGGSTDGSGANDVPADQFPDALARAICGNVGPCCAAENRPFDRGNCEVVLAQFYRVNFDLAMAGDAGAGYDATQSGACLDSVRAAAGECSFSSIAGTDCAGVLPGSSSDRGETGDPCSKTCTEAPAATVCSFTMLGGSDAGPDPQSCYTNDGLYCDTATARCAAQSAVGDSCQRDEQCQDAFCEGGVCTALLDAGEPCTWSGECAEGLYCGSADTCVRQKADGEPCSGYEECESGDCAEGTCGSISDGAFLALACTP